MRANRASADVGLRNVTLLPLRTTPYQCCIAIHSRILVARFRFSLHNQFLFGQSKEKQNLIPQKSNNRLGKDLTYKKKHVHTSSLADINQHTK